MLIVFVPCSVFRFFFFLCERIRLQERKMKKLGKKKKIWLHEDSRKVRINHVILSEESQVSSVVTLSKRPAFCGAAT
jgi:hypothetical protein